MRIYAAALTLLVLATPTAAATSGRWPRHPPASAFKPVMLYPTPVRAVRLCRRVQSRAPVLILCPRRVPRADYGYGASTHPPKLSAVVAGNLGHPRRDGRFGVELSYSAPVEPQSGSGWRQHLWLNRPCCFFHFTVWRRSPTPKLPSGLRRFSIGARHGLLEEARGYGLDESTGIYWSNHDWFFWRERGEPYAASLHFFGRGPTLALLRRLVVGLVPAKSL
ncbi:MAG TPA: hypothetical protein VF895_03870 [Gaiellaceae bacterium]